MVVSELYGSVLRLYLPKTNVNLCIFAPILDSVKVYCLHVQNSRPLCVLQDLLLKRKMHLTQFVCLTQPQPHSPPTRTRPEEDPPKPEPPGSSGGVCTRDSVVPHGQFRIGSGGADAEQTVPLLPVPIRELPSSEQGSHHAREDLLGSGRDKTHPQDWDQPFPNHEIGQADLGLRGGERVPREAPKGSGSLESRRFPEARVESIWHLIRLLR